MERNRKKIPKNTFFLNALQNVFSNSFVLQKSEVLDFLVVPENCNLILHPPLKIPVDLEQCSPGYGPGVFYLYKRIFTFL